jgi:predicted metal-dependent hydrolase
MGVMRIGALALQVNRKAIKNLHISVLPPDGKVRVSAPRHLSDTAIRMAVISRIPWIKRQQKDFSEQPRQSERQLVSGETHYVWGRRYRLDVIERQGRHEVVIKGTTRLQLYVTPGTSPENRATVLNEWYRQQMKERIPALLKTWQCKIRVRPADWGVKKMKTKWGSCSIAAGRIWLNLDLAKKPPECLEYILVHELVHLLERHHNERFKTLMDKHLPNWRESREMLNRMPLAQESWCY